jgi:ABC-type Zn uptake system ZnuABC Zn-binding protein ZnuA
MKHLKKFNESPFFGSDWGNDDDDDIGPLSHWNNDDFEYPEKQFNLNSTSIQDIIDNYESSSDGFIPKVIDLLKHIQVNLINQESITINWDESVAKEMKKIGFPVSKVGNKLRISWSYE